MHQFSSTVQPACTSSSPKNGGVGHVGRGEDQFIEDLMQADIQQAKADHDQPMTAPERKATCKPRLRPSWAPCAVREDAWVAVFIPEEPAQAGEKPARQKGNRHKRVLDSDFWPG